MTDSPAVSDHALIRYLERVHGIDMDACRDAILTPDAVSAIKAGAHTIKVNGIKFAVRNGVVTTVLVTRNEFNRLDQRARDD